MTLKNLGDRFTCDGPDCSTPPETREEYSGAPDGWIQIIAPETPRDLNSPSPPAVRTYHFCDDNCLLNWTTLRHTPPPRPARRPPRHIH